MRPDAPVAGGTAALFLKGLRFERLLSVVDVLGEVFVTAAMELLLLLLPLPLLLLLLLLLPLPVPVLAGLVEVAVGVGLLLLLPPPPGVQMAAPFASRPQVLPGGQQKDSPGHSTFALSAQPETVVQVLPRGQHPMSPLSAVKHF